MQIAFWYLLSYILTDTHGYEKCEAGVVRLPHAINFLFWPYNFNIMWEIFFLLNIWKDLNNTETSMEFFWILPFMRQSGRNIIHTPTVTFFPQIMLPNK